MIPVSKKPNPIPCPSVLYHICMSKRGKHSYPPKRLTWGSSENVSLRVPCLPQCRNLHTQPPPLNNVAKIGTDKWKCTLHWMPVYELRDTARVLHTEQRQNALHALAPEECNTTRRTGHRATQNRRKMHEKLETKLSKLFLILVTWFLKNCNLSAISLRNVSSATQKCLFVFGASSAIVTTSWAFFVTRLIFHSLFRKHKSLTWRRLGKFSSFSSLKMH